MSQNYYVYTLSYPESMGGTVFYVGKGKGSRIHAHEREARQGMQSYKCNVIRKIWEHGEQIIKRKVAEHLTEEDAYAEECIRIQKYGRENLANLTDGGEGGNGGSRENAGRHHKHQEYLCVHVLSSCGKKDLLVAGPLLNRNGIASKDVMNRAEKIASHHVEEHARSVRILKRRCCGHEDAQIVKVIKSEEGGCAILLATNEQDAERTNP